jgi:hypothetical protein
MENIASCVLLGSKIHVVSSRYVSCTFLTYCTCGNCTISMYFLKQARNNYFPSPTKFEM